MPRFFMHIRDGDKWIEDREGQSFPSVEAAREDAVSAIREMLAERVRQGKVVDGQRLEIADETGTTVLVLPFKDGIILH